MLLNYYIQPIQARFPKQSFASDMELTSPDTLVTDRTGDLNFTRRGEVLISDSDSQLESSHLADAHTTGVTLRSSSDVVIDPDKANQPVASALHVAKQVHEPALTSESAGEVIGIHVSDHNAEEWCLNADNFLKKGDFTKALNAYNYAVKADPSLTKAYFGKARVLTQQGELTSAIQSYEMVLMSDPDSISALRNLGWLHMRQRQYLQALKHYDRAINLSPDNVQLIFTRANAYYKLTDYTSALTGYDEVIRRDSSFIEAYLNRGMTHAVLREYRRAIADFNQVITLDPKNGIAYHRRGRAYAKLQQFALAEKDFTYALELIPHFVGIYIDLGLLYTKQAEYGRALDIYLKAIVQEPDNATAYYNAACIAALAGDVDEASRNLEIAIDLHPPYREMAITDSDFSTIRHSPEFQKCVELT